MDKSITLEIIRDDGQKFVIDNTDWYAIASGFDGWGNFENDISTVDNAIGDGGTISGYRVAQKDRTIKAVLIAQDNKEAMRRQASAFFNSSQTYKVYITYMGLTRWCEGMVHKFELETNIAFAPLWLTVTFMCPKPFLNSYDNFGKNIASSVGMMAFPYLASITTGTAKGTTGGRFSFARKVTLNNDGDTATYCQAIFRAIGDVTNPQFLINDKYVRFLGALEADDELVFDFTANPPTVKLNGVNSIGKCDRTSAFDEMVLNIGDNTIAFDADAGSNLLSVTIYYNKMYVTI